MCPALLIRRETRLCSQTHPFGDLELKEVNSHLDKAWTCTGERTELQYPVASRDPCGVPWLGGDVFSRL